MLSFGAAEASIYLLQRYRLLEILLPVQVRSFYFAVIDFLTMIMVSCRKFCLFMRKILGLQAAYLLQHDHRRSGQSPLMLMVSFSITSL